MLSTTSQHAMMDFFSLWRVSEGGGGRSYVLMVSIVDPVYCAVSTDSPRTSNSNSNSKQGVAP